MSGLNAQVIILVPTGTADYTQTFISDPWDCELSLNVNILPAPSGDDLVAPALTDIPTGGMWLKAHLDQMGALPDVADTQVLFKRTIPGISLVMSTPAVVGGRPMSPKYWTQNDASIDIRTDFEHLAAINDPDPKYNTTTHLWSPPLPGGGVGDYRWTVNSLPDPADYGGEYDLGGRTSQDGTAQLPVGASQWAADPGTAGPAWLSSYPYKPTVRPYVHHNKDGTTYTQPRGVYFNRHYADHMWTDLGASGNAMPFTWIIVAIVINQTGKTQRHYLLDSGKSPFTYLHNQTEDNVSADYDIVGKDEGLNYRNYMVVDSHYMYLSSKTGYNMHCRYAAAPKPRMFYGIFNTNNTYVGNYSTGNQIFHFKGKMPASSTNHRYYVMGRSCGHIGSSWASNMVVFEARYWRRALTVPELNAQYNQLASTWRFSQYK